MASTGNGQQALSRVLSVYALIDPDVAYCQGMSFVVAMLLSYLSEEHAFYIFVDIELQNMLYYWY